MSFINSTRVRKIVRALMLVIPILVQCCVSVVAFIHQQWILLAMTIPALCAALYYIIDRSESKKQEAPQQNTEALSSSIEEEHQQIIPQALESLLFSNNNTHSLMWRNIVFKWLQQAKTIPLGTTIQGLYILDIHSKGPHALIAGTTGSGKSILLESWCLSYATSFSPEQLQFVFLDFKGGATFSALRKLPHCVGNVSDLNISHASRALRALELELQRRETIFA
ncbi:MAG: FtsK/SpoIIIE domain-containing protein, partial [Bifidobacteriaceae bacterium]|nr:FtsK/SpoIIIE domain-containing protein [Bifidobacteriaceae bacterium]